ncbi:MAG: aminomethyl-transferring glycine dehydrogenase subunit GcvPB [Coriobacteriia bacterium]|nr:aminomethyl-transferring glycine dehydrogenase subunit GcvPB [Coriobacteriia bacterium]
MGEARQGGRPLVFEVGAPGLRVGVLSERLDVPVVEPAEAFGPAARAEPPMLPHATEGQLARHYARLAAVNFGVDTGFYPLGSCTMKHNPRVSEDAARLPGFAAVHPYQPASTVQGALGLMHALQGVLAEVSGLPGVTLQPSAGAHGELTALLVFRAAHGQRGDATSRRCVLVPDTAHGTNPASVAMAGWEVRQVPTDGRGNIDLGELRSALGPHVAAVMLTNPNTLGLFEERILEVTASAHRAGAFVYCDGANLNAILGKARPGDMGFDALHVNLHKTFATPHGGGGPGSGPVCVSAELAPYLPAPVVAEVEGGGYGLVEPERTIGRVRSFLGNFGVAVRAYAYALALGSEGLEEVAEQAVLSANYLKERLKVAYDLPYDRTCMHEFVLSGRRQRRRAGIRALDIAKRLLDFGFHPPTVYFPLVVEEALMIEPTETEDPDTLDAFAEAMLRIAREAEEEPEVLRSAPHATPVRRLDEVRAARRPDLRWRRVRARGGG